MQTIDIQIFFLINRGMANPLFDLLMPVLTFQGYLLALPLLPYLVYRATAAKDAAGRSRTLLGIATVLIAVAAVVLADALGSGLKDLIGRLRPCADLHGVRLLVKCPSSFSMPSSHATTSFAFATPFVLLARDLLPFRWRMYPVVLAALIAFSRPYLGVHYPSDILAGTLLGAAVAGLMCWGFTRIQQQRLPRGRKGRQEGLGSSSRA